MKKILSVLALVGCVAFANNVKAGGDDIIEGGPFITTGLYAPSAHYYLPSTLTNTGDIRFTGLSFQFGHDFLIAAFSPMSVSIRATWVELNGAIDNESSTNNYIFQGSILKLGPQFTVKFSDETAMDLFGQVSPTVAVTGEFGNSSATSSVGATGTLGAAFRFKKMIIGTEYCFGRVLNNDARGSGPLSATTGAAREDLKYRTNHIKIVLGLQFGKP